MGETYRSINEINSNSGAYKKGSFVDSVVSDLRIKENEKRLVGKLISCNKCIYPNLIKVVEDDLIPGIRVVGYKMEPCNSIDPENFPTRLCGHGITKSAENLNKKCQNCMYADRSQIFEVSKDGNMTVSLILYHCKFTKKNSDIVWNRANYFCKKFKPLEKTK